MSAVSEAMDRASKRLDAMTPERRVKLYHIVLREELQRGIALPEPNRSEMKE